MTKLARYALLTTLLLSSTAQATTTLNDLGIDQLVFSRGTDTAVIEFSGGTGNPAGEGCDRSDAFVMPLSSGNAHREQAMLSALLVAYSTNATISVLLSGCASSVGGDTYPAVWYLYLPSQ